MTAYHLGFFVFISITLFVLGIYRLYAVDTKSKNTINKRLKALEQATNSEEAFELIRKNRGLWLIAKGSRFSSLGIYLIQTGLEISLNLALKFLFVYVVVAIIILYFMNGKWYGFFVSLFLTTISISAFLAWIRSSRIAKFEKQLPDALEIMVRSLRAGHPTQTAIALAATECADPIGTEFGIASDEIRHGLDITSALKNMSDRVGMPDLIYVEAAIAVQSQSGGSLSEVIARLSYIIRERFKLKHKVAALTSEGRISGIFLTSLPIVMGLVIMLLSPSYYLDAINEPIFSDAMTLCFVLLLIGNAWIKKIITFRY